MRCARAQQWMTAAADGEVSPRRRRALDRHLAACSACRDDAEVTARLLAAVGMLPAEAVVPARLEQDTLRRVRLLAADDDERHVAARWFGLLGLPAVAVAGVAVAVIAAGLLRQDAGPPPVGTASEPARVARAPQAPPAPRAAPAPTSPPRAVAPEAAPAAAPPVEPPPELAAAPDLFIELPVLRNLEKLEHYDAIRTTNVDGGTGSVDGERSSG